MKQRNARKLAKNRYLRVLVAHQRKYALDSFSPHGGLRVPIYASQRIQRHNGTWFIIW